MRCPTLKELPLPPSAKTGWPWTEGSPQLPDSMSDGLPWPKISIVTPSFNQGQFIEETIRSVLLQGYPDLEYFIIDGGSKDDSVDIIKKYEQWLAYWVSEPDRGQSHAINKGFARASGEIYAYLNSDDLYEPGCCHIVSQHFIKVCKPNLIIGKCIFFNKIGTKSISNPVWPDELEEFLYPLSLTFGQPSAFWSSNLYRFLVSFDETLNFCLDLDFFLRAGLKGIQPEMIPNILSRFRNYGDHKSRSQILLCYKETIMLIDKLGTMCGLSENEKTKRIGGILEDIEYVKILLTWKTKGRIHAIFNYAALLLRSPKLILQRRFLGLGRRILYFSPDRVMEMERIL